MCDKYPDNYYIISSRPSDRYISWHRFEELGIVPLNKKDAVSLIKKVDLDKEIKDKFIKRLNDSLFYTHKEFASNPLLLTIMLLTFNYYAEVPNKMYVFYERAFETLLCSHDATKGAYKRELSCGLQRDEFEEFVYIVSFILYAKRKFKFSSKELKDAIIEVCNIKEINVDKQSIIDDMLNSICILIKDGIEYKYIHRSFQEYFAAVYIKEQTDNKQRAILDFLFKSDGDILEDDILFKLLFNMCKEKLERNFIMPQLLRMKRAMQKVDVLELGIIKECLVSIDEIIVSSDITYEMAYTPRKNNWEQFLVFMEEQYSFYFNGLDESKSSIALEKYIKKNGKINLESITKDDLIYHDILVMCYPEIQRYYMSMDVLDKIRNVQIQSPKNILNVIRRKKSKKSSKSKSI